MTSAKAKNGRESALPSRTAILVAAARAFGSREPDESVRNPDSLAALLIEPSELALISEYPISAALRQDYAEASQTSAVVFFAALMLWRTRFIDEVLQRAVKSGATRQGLAKARGPSISGRESACIFPGTVSARR